MVLLLVTSLAACEIAGWPFLREPAQSLLTRKLERPVRIDKPFRLHVLGHLRLKTGGLWIAAPADFDAPHFVNAKDIEVAMHYGDLWTWQQSGDLRIRSLAVGQLDARLLRHKDGKSTWQLKPRETTTPPALPTVDHLAVRQGHLVVRDPVLAVGMDATFETREGTAAANAVSHLEAKGDFRNRPFKGEISTAGWLPVVDSGDAAAPVPAKGWLEYGGLQATFDGVVRDFISQQGMKGAVSLRGPSLSLAGRLVNAPLPVTGPFSLQGQVSHDGQAWDVVVDSAEVGRSELAGHFNYRPGPRAARLDGQLRGKRFVLADLGPTFGTRDEDGNPVAPLPGHVLPHRRLDLPALKKVNGRIDVDLDRVELGKVFAQPITPLKALLTVENGRLTLAQIDARTAEGRLTGQMAADAGPEVPAWQADLTVDGIQLQDWLKSGMTKKGKKEDNGNARPYVTGSLHGRAKLTGQGSSGAEILASLTGESTFFIQDGTLSRLVIEALGLDVAQALGLVLSGDETMPMRCAVMDLDGKKGVFIPRLALIDTPVTLILADGSVDLAHEALDLRLVAKPKNVSPFTMRSPIHLEGPFAAPRVTPEPVPIAARVLGGLALATVNPLAAILPFLDPGDKVASPCRDALASLRRTSALSPAQKAHSVK